MRAVVRVFSYLFHGLLTLFLLALAAMALSSGQTLHLDMLPWHGQSLSYWLLFSALAGLVSLILAILRTWRLLFVLWSLAVLVVMVRGFFLGPYEFAGQAGVLSRAVPVGGRADRGIGSVVPVTTEGGCRAINR